MSALITVELLEQWYACRSGILKFKEKYPNGATLQQILDDRTEENDSDILWLFNQCRSLNLYNEVTALGYRNSGNWNTGNYNSGNYNSGYRNSGYRNSGDRNSGDRNSGDWNTGDRNSGNYNSGDRNSGNYNSGDRNSGNCNSGYRNSGDWNTGYRNSGYRNSGNWNTGDRNSGNWNTGNYNSGNYNSGYHNSGDRNSGDRNSGYRNSGDWNSCDNESGFFNSVTATTIRVFNREVNIEEWQRAEKPNFIYDVELTYVQNDELKTRSYKEAWQLAYSKASDKDVELLMALPNFDARVFEEITDIKIEETEK
jgi:hypothetical protein